MGFELKHVTEEEYNKMCEPKPPHSVDEDPLYNMCVENKTNANKAVKEGNYDQAIASYSELIMQSRALEKEEDIVWDDEGAGKKKVFQLRAAAYLNLSLCFLKQQQWTHASNTATRALQGDKEPADPEEDVLDDKQKAKALFRRAEAQMEGFGNFDKGREDLEAALKLTPDDKAIMQQLKKVQLAQKKVAKAADKKMTGFLNTEKAKKGEGIFSDKDRERDTSAPKLKEPVKLQEGLWIAPKDEDKEKETGGNNDLGLDYDELSREITEMKESAPETYAAMKAKTKELVEQMVAEREAKGEIGTGAELPNCDAMTGLAKDMIGGLKSAPEEVIEEFSTPGAAAVEAA
jgi:tetratricopeptide (TPR) repeat protein